MTTAHDLGRVLYSFHAAAAGNGYVERTTGLTRAQAQRGLALLVHSARGGLIEPYAGAPTAHKEGWISDFRGSAAIVYGRTPTVVVVLAYRPGIGEAEARELGRRAVAAALAIEHAHVTVDHRQLGVDLFNYTWTLLERDDRTPDDDDELIDAAHASAHHWRRADGVRPENRARSEWQLSRVYSVLGRTEPALYHAQRCLDHCVEHGLADWDLAFAYEALARAHKLAGDEAECARHVELARAVADRGRGGPRAPGGVAR